MTNAFGISDAARRISDAVQQAITDGYRNKWMAFAMDDGTGDGTRYDTKADAIRYHGNKYRGYLYLQVPWDMLTSRAAEVYLRLHRQLKEIGQHPDDEMAKHEFMFDNRREAYPALDARRILAAQFDRHGRPVVRAMGGGLIVPRGAKPGYSPLVIP